MRPRRAAYFDIENGSTFMIMVPPSHQSAPGNSRHTHGAMNPIRYSRIDSAGPSSNETSNWPALQRSRSVNCRSVEYSLIRIKSISKPPERVAQNLALATIVARHVHGTSGGIGWRTSRTLRNDKMGLQAISAKAHSVVDNKIDPVIAGTKTTCCNRVRPFQPSMGAPSPKELEQRLDGMSFPDGAGRPHVPGSSINMRVYLRLTRRRTETPFAQRSASPVPPEIPPRVRGVRRRAWATAAEHAAAQVESRR